MKQNKKLCFCFCFFFWSGTKKSLFSSKNNGCCSNGQTFFQKFTLKNRTTIEGKEGWGWQTDRKNKIYTTIRILVFSHFHHLSLAKNEKFDESFITFKGVQSLQHKQKICMYLSVCVLVFLYSNIKKWKGLNEWSLFYSLCKRSRWS